MKLQLDVGNTWVKWRLRDDSGIADRGVLQRTELAALPRMITATVDQVQVSSVAGETTDAELAQLLQDRFSLLPWFAHSSRQACGLHNSYTDPSRMGVDRWLAMLAAWKLAGSGLCVVDAGSALTIDFVDGDGKHGGGYILPGIDSMESALLSDTDRVRFGDAPRDRLQPGRSTEEGVYNGLLLSQAGAVTLAWQRYGMACSLFFSGGNGEVLQRVLQLGGEYRADLVLDGLELLGEEYNPE